MTQAQKASFARPLNVAVARGSRAEKFFRNQAGLPGEPVTSPEAITPGVHPTPRHDLIFHGGKTIQDLTFLNFYLGGADAWKADDIQQIDYALGAAMADKNLNNVMIQYFHNQPITSTFKGSQTLDGPPPTVFSQGDVERLITQLYQQGALTGVDLSTTVCNVLLPSGAVLNTDTSPTNTATEHPVLSVERRNPVHPESEASSLEGLGGYHGSVHVTTDVTVYYAVGVFSEQLPDGTENGIVAFDAPWKNVVATFYHELNEARTDADVEDAIKAGNDPNAASFLGWVSRQGEECGDFPVFESSQNLSLVMQEVPLTDRTGTVPVQFQYSNAIHGPEGPISVPHPLPTHAH